MGARGPAPTPTSILHLRGSWRAKTRGDQEVKPKGRPICPAWIMSEGKKYWRKIVPGLVALGVIGEIDGHVLARYCQMYAQWRQAEQFLMAYGFNEKIIEYRENTAADGTVTRKPYVAGQREYPQVRQARALHKDMLNIERSFGMNPSARASLTTEKPETKLSKRDHVKQTLSGA